MISVAVCFNCGLINETALKSNKQKFSEIYLPNPEMNSARLLLPNQTEENFKN